jgi:hypothetical protein
MQLLEMEEQNKARQAEGATMGAKDAGENKFCRL